MPTVKRSKRLFLSEKAITRMQTITIVIVLVVAIAAVYLVTRLPAVGPENGSDGNGAKDNGNEEPLLQPADLTVGQIMVNPVQAGKFFRAWVGIGNIGEVKSGSYHLRVWIEDVSRGDTYPQHYDVEDPMDPTPQNQYIIVWESETVAVNYEGSYILYAEITPIDFEDGDPTNNQYGWAFEASAFSG
jgi:hypothetical protein